MSIAAVVLSALSAGWMTFDGAHALVTGNYVVPASGEYAGQLGPWAALVRTVGVDPLDVSMKLAFLVIGLTWLIVCLLYVRHPAPVRTRAMMAYCIATLWYLPVGTVLSIAALTLLSLSAQKRRQSAN